MTTRPSLDLRRQVIARADNCCEYCLLPQELVASTHQVNHVIAEKHGGQTVLENLALSCTVCNRRQGSDISSLDPATGALVSLFNPRTQRWGEHFRLTGEHTLGVTAEAARLSCSAIECDGTPGGTGGLLADGTVSTPAGSRRTPIAARPASLWRGPTRAPI
jgi:hypothetical protein